MKIPTEVRSKYDVDDADTAVFLDLWDETEGSKVLEVGAHDEPTANMLSESGYDVTGIDLREYDKTQGECNYRFLRGDLCNPPEEIYKGGKFDAIYALSCLEHFGLCTYDEGSINPLYDVIGARMIWTLLKEGGRAYITIPFSGWFTEIVPHWRIYNFQALGMRIIQDFRVERFSVFVSGDITVSGRKLGLGDSITVEEAMLSNSIVPHISAIVLLRKEAVSRLAPDGR